MGYQRILFVTGILLYEETYSKQFLGGVVILC
jgi:hypothetical protein